MAETSDTATWDALRARRRRRRLRRAAAAVLFLLLATGIAWFFESQATTTLLVVSACEPDFGTVRAEELARLLSGPEHSPEVNAIYVPDRSPARMLAEPLARAGRLPLLLMDFDRPEQLVRRAFQDYKGESILVVTRPGELLKIVKFFRGDSNSGIADELTSLYVLTLPWFGPAKTLRMHFAASAISGGGAPVAGEGLSSKLSSALDGG